MRRLARHRRRLAWGLFAVFAMAFAGNPAQADEPPSAAEARSAIERAGRFFTETLSLDGGYVWRYSADLTVREGEGQAEANIAWVQPPGTPAIGAAFLRLYVATGDGIWRDAAFQAAEALLRTQLASGGWYYSIDMAADAPSRWCYRAAGIRGDACSAVDGNPVKNETTLDDDTTQAALRFLLWLDEVSNGQDARLGDAIVYALDRIALSQYPNGAWPVLVGRRPGDAATADIQQATLPQIWSREWVKPEQGPYYILNDDTQRDTTRLFLLAADRFGREDFAEAAARAGGFLLQAQLPEPQRGWAQTYDAAMQPVWGRPFEPPAVASRETAGALETLMDLHDRFEDPRYLAAAREGAAWLRKVRLPDGDWARFYELHTDRPLYVDGEGRLTESADDLMDGYTLKSEFAIPEILARVDAASVASMPTSYWTAPSDALSDADLQRKVDDLIGALRPEGYWLNDGWIESAQFVDAAFAFARYIERNP